GEIALSIIRTAKAEVIHTVAIYTSSDALPPHVTLADEALFLAPASDNNEESESESKAYLSAARIVALCKAHDVTLLGPGYGFLSENAAFAQAVLDAGIIWLGPTPGVIKTMGLKHLAREVMMEAGVVCVPGSTGLVTDEKAGQLITARIGFPVMLEASAGGGGMGMIICADEDAEAEASPHVRRRAEVRFPPLILGGIFLMDAIDFDLIAQIFGNGVGDRMCMGERECSIKYRHQKIIEETPSPFLVARPDLRARMCEAAVWLGAFVKYSSTGTVELLVDNESGNSFFLEINTRIQVRPQNKYISGLPDLDDFSGLARNSVEMQQSTYDSLLEKAFASGVGHAMEARIYAENPATRFRPCPGVSQYLRVDTWCVTGPCKSPQELLFDPLLAKIVVSGESRAPVISRMRVVLQESHIQGPANNIEYLFAILDSEGFQSGNTTTQFLTSFQYTPWYMIMFANTTH
ncbi:hypothetical protein B0H14DRAFT_2417282, partial [Mycena olivaceomarginata]